MGGGGVVIEGHFYCYLDQFVILLLINQGILYGVWNCNGKYCCLYYQRTLSSRMLAGMLPAWWGSYSTVDWITAQLSSFLYFIIINYSYQFYFFILLWFSTISWTTLGSARVEISPRSSVWLAATFLRILLMIFPDLVLGNPVVNCIISGTAKPEIFPFIH